MDTTPKYGRGQHPNSQDSLNRKGRSPQYGIRKPRHAVYVSAEAWVALEEIATEKLNCNSISDLLEKIGRGEISCSIPNA